MKSPDHFLIHTRSLLIPKGCPTIARRFNAGTAHAAIRVPKGRLNIWLLLNPAQPFLRDLLKITLFPGVKTPGYFHLVPVGQYYGIRKHASHCALPSFS